MKSTLDGQLILQIQPLLLSFLDGSANISYRNINKCFAVYYQYINRQ